MARKIVVGDCFERNGEICTVTNATHNQGFYDADWATESYKTGSFRVGYYKPLPTLHLPIGNDPKKYGGAWFDMILSGEKTEEYREVNAFYESRFYCALENPHRATDVEPTIRKDLKVLHLTNGSGHHRPQLWAHIESISIGRGKPEWGAPIDRDVFIIKLGSVFHSKNLNP